MKVSILLLLSTISIYSSFGNEENYIEKSKKETIIKFSKDSNYVFHEKNEYFKENKFLTDYYYIHNSNINEVSGVRFTFYNDTCIQVTKYISTAYYDDYETYLYSKEVEEIEPVMHLWSNQDANILYIVKSEGKYKENDLFTVEIVSKRWFLGKMN